MKKKKTEQKAFPQAQKALADWERQTKKNKLKFMKAFDVPKVFTARDSYL